MERYELPEGWVSIPFEQAVNRIQNKNKKLKTKEYQEKGKYPVIDQGQSLIVAYTNREDYLFRGPLPVIIFGDHTKSVKFIEFPFVVGADGVVILRPINKIDPRFLYCWLRFVPLHDLGYSRHYKLLREQSVSFPDDLDEQRRIVARIEELTRRVEEAKRLRQDAIKKAKNYLPSAIDRVFLENNSTRWRRKKVRALSEKPQYGYTESAIFESVGPKFLRITDIQDGKVNWEDVPFCRCDEVEKYKLSKGDIVFARTGATTGKSYLIEQQPDNAIFASYLIRLRPKEEIAPEFLYWYFQSSLYWRSVFAGVEDGNRPSMNGSKLGNIEIPYPQDKTEQRSIVNYLNSLRVKADELIRLQTETDAELAAFTPAVLAKAFSGEL